jgi:S-adenosylmethionine:tRNA ribosyltransferase-isomerase
VRVSDFDYELPEELIAAAPVAERDASRLLVVSRADGSLGHRTFGELPSLLAPGDLVVLNDTRVVPARLRGRLATGRAVEALLVEERGGGVWAALVSPGKAAHPGQRLGLAAGRISAEVVGRNADLALLRLAHAEPLGDILAACGEMPVPPYLLKRRARAADMRPASSPPPDFARLDRERYQTVYAREEGAIAAPTAGLHFTEALLARVRAGGLATAFVTLHVGIGTFRPVKGERVEDHRMGAERYRIPEATALAVKEARARGGRVVAIGTTTTRALEHAAEGGSVRSGEGRADLFIYPGYRFRVVDALVTNFHLPRSTLLMLVSAFAGRGLIRRAYAEAIRERYRFYSYGDAMLIL